MNYPQAIVAAAGILAGAIVLNQLGQTAPVPPLPWRPVSDCGHSGPEGGQRLAARRQDGRSLPVLRDGGDVRGHLPARADDRAQRF